MGSLSRILRYFLDSEWHEREQTLPIACFDLRFESFGRTCDVRHDFHSLEERVSKLAQSFTLHFLFLGHFRLLNYADNERSCGFCSSVLSRNRLEKLDHRVLCCILYSALLFENSRIFYCD